MDGQVAAFYLVYSEQEYKGEHHLYIRGLFLRYDKAFDAAVRLTKREPFEESEQPDYEIIHEKRDEIRLRNNRYYVEGEYDDYEEIVVAKLHVQ